MFVLVEDYYKDNPKPETEELGISEESYRLAIRERYPLWMKLEISKLRIIQWINYWQGCVYVCFSGGLDSTVLVDIVRSIYPGVPIVFCDTGQEYPEIRRFAKSLNDVTVIRPKMTYEQVIEDYGYPIISKKVAMGFDRYSNGDAVQKQLRLYGGINPTSRKPQARTIPLKFHYLINEDYKISDRCCDILKKRPFKEYEKKTGFKPIIGTRIAESEERKIQYLKHGCNAFNKDAPQSNPLSFWTDADIKEYIETNDLLYCEIYDSKEGKWKGEKRTGCMGCGFGIHMEDRPNRFDRMEVEHPKHYNLYMNKLGMKKIVEPLYKQTQTKLFEV